MHMIWMWITDRVKLPFNNYGDHKVLCFTPCKFVYLKKKKKRLSCIHDSKCYVRIYSEMVNKDMPEKTRAPQRQDAEFLLQWL